VLAVMAVGAVVAGGLNAVRQGIQMSEDPRKRAEGFSWSELGISMGLGAVIAPVAVFAPEVAIPLVGMGVANGIEQYSEGNYLTGTFDIVTSLAPFGSKNVRSASFGKGSYVGQVRGLGPADTFSTRAGRFTLIEENLQNFAPSPTGKDIGVGFAKMPDGPDGHVAVIFEKEGGGFWFAEKNAKRGLSLIPRKAPRKRTLRTSMKRKGNLRCMLRAPLRIQHNTHTPSLGRQCNEPRQGAPARKRHRVIRLQMRQLFALRCRRARAGRLQRHGQWACAGPVERFHEFFEGNEHDVCVADVGQAAILDADAAACHTRRQEVTQTVAGQAAHGPGAGRTGDAAVIPGMRDSRGCRRVCRVIATRPGTQTWASAS